MRIITFIKILAISLSPGFLVGQSTQRSETVIARSVSANMDMKSFLRRVSTNPPATLVLFDTSEKEWEEEFERIRREDPYAVLNLNFIALAVEQSVGNELREREGWQAQKPHWAIFNPEGRIVAEGAILPTSTQLANACVDANIISKVESFRRFLREHPNHEEAREIMLVEMAEIAGIRTRNALQVPEHRAATGTFFSAFEGVTIDSNADRGNPTPSQIETLPELTSDVDERIWRDYCGELQRYLEGKLWQSGGSASMSINRLVLDPKSIVTAWAVFSPITRATYSKVATIVEAALERQPTSSVLWGIWVTMQKTGAGKSMKELLAILQPSPNVAPADWPPASVRTAYIKSCRDTGDWSAIQDLVEPIWNSVSSTSASVNQRIRSANTPAISIDNISVFTQGFWLSSGEPYLEALLRLQRLSEAEQMMRTWASGSGWPGAFLSAATIAERLGYESVAKGWREQGEKK